jgi:hypothetical protein
LKGHQLLKVFYFLFFDLEYLIRVQSFKPLHAKMNPISSSFGSRLHVLKPQPFPPNHAPKMWERHQLFFGLPLVRKKFQHSAIQTKIEQHFVGFFHQIKVRQPIGRQCAAKAFYSCPAIISQRLESRIISKEPQENTEEESKII